MLRELNYQLMNNDGHLSTSSTEVVKQCQEYFAFEIPSVL